MPILQVREPRPGAILEHFSIRHFSEPTPLQEPPGFHPQGSGKCRLTLSSRGEGSLEPNPSPTAQVVSGRSNKRPSPCLDPSIPFRAAVTSSCLRFCTVSQSGEERRGGEETGF